MADEPSIFKSKPEHVKRLFQYVFAEPQAKDHAPPVTSVDTIAEKPGGRIDRYLLQCIIGEGGMGIVYLAEQQEPVKRQVALKVIKPGMDSRRVIARFEAEQQTLALMEHPHIAHVYDAGLTLSGRLYFVMEFVKGLSITEHCDRHKLTIEQRLRIFQQVCLAVQHAHQKGIIHRDIKPSNILVVSQEGKAIPKIIDFGVAKAISKPLADQTFSTVDSQLLGTPEYMSPEQADMASEDIDTRSDIYSLGVLLYVLLTGVLPFDSNTLREGGIDNIRKVIRQTDPKTPSTRLMKLGQEAGKIAENRRTEIHSLARHLKKELEWIPLKAMRKERAERYRSASELSDDIDNYLKGNPLIAGPPSTWYRLSKSVRRHKAIAGGIAAVLVTCVIGTIVSVIFALGQASALAQNRAMATFLNDDILDTLARAQMQNITIREVLDTAIKKLGTRFSDYPLLEASMWLRFGNIYVWQFSDYDVALPSLERALELQQQHGAHAFFTMNWLGLAYNGAGRYQEAEAMFRTIVESFESGERELSGLYPFAKSHLGGICQKLGRYDEAECHLREALDVAAWGKESSWRLCYSGGLATVFMDQGRYEEAVRIYDSIVRTGRSLQDKGDPDMQVIYNTFGAMYRLGELHTLRGNLPDAALWLEEGLKEAERACGPEHFRTIAIKIALAVLRTKQGDYKEAELLFDESLRNLQARMDDTHPELLRTKSHLGVLYREQGRHDEAEKLLNEVIKGQSEKLGSDHPHVLESMLELAVLYREQGDYAKAEPLLIEAFEGRCLKLGDQHPHTQESLKNLIDLYKVWNKPEKANEWRARLAQTEDSEE